MPTIDETLAALGVSPCPDEIREHWDESMATLPEGPLPLLDPERVRRHAKYGALPSEAVDLALKAAAKITGDPNLTRLIWHAYRLAFEHLDAPAKVLRALPDLPKALGDDWGQFYTLVSLEAIPRMIERDRERGVPDEITRDTMRDIYHHSQSRRAFYGHWGMRQRTLYWFRHHTKGEIHRLGRLQFIPEPNKSVRHVFRHRVTREVVALSPDGVEYGADGYILDDATHPRDREGGWTARLEESDDAVVGCPLAPMGMASRQTVTLKRDEWNQALAEGDPILDMHIPEGGRMTPEACRDSFAEATTFFPKYFPEITFKAYTCRSWIFNTQFEEHLPPESNLVQFQRQLYITPLKSNGKSGLYFIFGDDNIDAATAPRDTSVRRALLDILAEGRGLRQGAVVFLPEEIEQFGQAPYRTAWPVRALA